MVRNWKPPLDPIYCPITWRLIMHTRGALAHPSYFVPRAAARACSSRTCPAPPFSWPCTAPVGSRPRRPPPSPDQMDPSHPTHPRDTTSPRLVILSSRMITLHGDLIRSPSNQVGASHHVISPPLLPAVPWNRHSAVSDLLALLRSHAHFGRAVKKAGPRQPYDAPL